jgi:hypothetical protein
MSIFLTTFHGNRCTFIRHIVTGSRTSVFIVKNSSSRSISTITTRYHRGLYFIRFYHQLQLSCLVCSLSSRLAWWFSRYTFRLKHLNILLESLVYVTILFGRIILKVTRGHFLAAIQNCGHVGYGGSMLSALALALSVQSNLRL